MKVINGIKVYSVQELAELLEVHPKTVLNYLKAGKIKGRKIGNRWGITEDALTDYLNGSDN